jgi:hypothetical protein
MKAPASEKGKKGRNPKRSTAIWRNLAKEEEEVAVSD